VHAAAVENAVTRRDRGAHVKHEVQHFRALDEALDRHAHALVARRTSRPTCSPRWS
jgi:hypothetical protein